ncbi:hypothetical protein BGX21_000843, partial [Mortierella sp. AD011]
TPLNGSEAPIHASTGGSHDVRLPKVPDPSSTFAETKILTTTRLYGFFRTSPVPTSRAWIV